MLAAQPIFSDMIVNISLFNAPIYYRFFPEFNYYTLLRKVTQYSLLLIFY